MTIRTCRLCGKEVDFDEPYCAHETMEESAWLDIEERAKQAKPFSSEQAAIIAIDPLVHQAAVELGVQAGKTMRDRWRRAYQDADKIIRRMEKEKHLSDIEFVNQNARGK